MTPSYERSALWLTPLPQAESVPRVLDVRSPFGVRSRFCKKRPTRLHKKPGRHLISRGDLMNKANFFAVCSAAISQLLRHGSGVATA